MRPGQLASQPASQPAGQRASPWPSRPAAASQPGSHGQPGSQSQPASQPQPTSQPARQICFALLSARNWSHSYEIYDFFPCVFCKRSILANSRPTSRPACQPIESFTERLLTFVYQNACEFQLLLNFCVPSSRTYSKQTVTVRVFCWGNFKLTSYILNRCLKISVRT